MRNLCFTAMEAAMRTVRFILLIVVAIFAVNMFGQEQAPDDIRLWITKEVMVEIVHDQISSVFERFTPTLRYSLSQVQMKNVLESLTSVTGPFKEQISQDRRIVNGAPIYVSRSQFQNHKVEMGLAFDDGNRITDIWIAPFRT